MFELNKEYLSPTSGFLRLALIIALLAAWISAAAVGDTGSSKYDATRTAFLVFSIMGFILSIIIFVLNLLNLVNMPQLAMIPWTIVFAVSDGILLISMFAVSIATAVAANKSEKFLKKGGFVAATIFGFISFLIYCVIMVFTILQIKKSGGIRISAPKSAQPASGQQQGSRQNTSSA
ncbi:unnamed protein product [Brachionus calyciflorus]|uniref:MARVEL domain-containing protein n=1 Tax=Brachionus calyciflorus TaxID=104777 RepID=A0A813Y6V4_9BILA|nr:unnamed protein product [Brachionus calyciflorus]